MSSARASRKRRWGTKLDDRPIMESYLKHVVKQSIAVVVAGTDIARCRYLRQRGVLCAGEHRRKCDIACSRPGCSNRRFFTCGHAPAEERGVREFGGPIPAGIDLPIRTRRASRRTTRVQVDEGRCRTKSQERSIQLGGDVFGWAGSDGG